MKKEKSIYVKMIENDREIDDIIEKINKKNLKKSKEKFYKALMIKEDLEKEMLYKNVEIYRVEMIRDPESETSHKYTNIYCDSLAKAIVMAKKETQNRANKYNAHIYKSKFNEGEELIINVSDLLMEEMFDKRQEALEDFIKYNKKDYLKTLRKMDKKQLEELQQKETKDLFAFLPLNQYKIELIEKEIEKLN